MKERLENLQTPVYTSRIMSALAWNALKKPIIALSPMADMTDSAFCRVVKEVTESWSHGVMERPSPLHHSTTPTLIVFREMVSAEAVVRGNDKTLDMTEIHEEERPIVQQLFGADPATMASAAAIIERDHHPEGFDINMGCPVYKVVHTFNGAALMQDPERAAEIVRRMKAAVSVPVSVKIRAGWEDPEECMTFGRVLEDAGADLITIHGRTKKQAYTGESDWNLIRRFKQTVTIPVLANGDIFTPQLAMEALETTQCDGVLIARGALGNPWIFSQIEDMLAGKSPKQVSLEKRIEAVKRHTKLHVDQYGERGIVTFRKHLSWYFKGIDGAKPFRTRLHTTRTVPELHEILDEILRDGLREEAVSRRDAQHPLASVRMHLAK